MRRRLVVPLLSLAVLASACVAGDKGPWVNEQGEIVSNAVLLEYQGLVACDQRDITFFRIFERQYANDPFGLLGELRSVDSARTLTFNTSTNLPATAEPLGITHGSREIYYNEPDVDDYLYIVIDGQLVERWPRAESECKAGL